MSLVIDGETFDVPVKVINRKAEFLYKYAERTEDGQLHSELIGVYYNYDLEIGASVNNVADYRDLWRKLTEPVTSHEITMPAEEDSHTFDCYFASIKDLVSSSGSVNYFRGLSFSVIATSPARTP